MAEGWSTYTLQPRRNYAPAIQAAMTIELKAQLASGIVESSKALPGTPVHMVRKDSFCVDLTHNKLVKTASHPLPKTNTVVESVKGFRYLARFDLQSCYWQFPVVEEDRHKLAFQVQGKVYRYRVDTIGHKQSSFYVQQAMEGVLRPLLDAGASIYLDDCVIHGKKLSEFFGHL